MTVSQPARVTYFVTTPQCGQRDDTVEEMNFFSNPAGPDYEKVVSVISGNSAFSYIAKADGSMQFFSTKNVVYARCKAKTPGDLPACETALVEIIFDNYNLAECIEVRDTPQNVMDLVRRSLNMGPVLFLSDGNSNTIVAKVSRIADVTVYSTSARQARGC